MLFPTAALCVWWPQKGKERPPQALSPSFHPPPSQPLSLILAASTQPQTASIYGHPILLEGDVRGGWRMMRGN